MLRRMLPAATLAVVLLAIPTPAQAISGMPASDGKPMLWPVASQQRVVEHGRTLRATRYGFVDTAARLVVPASYASYSYCADADGRAAAVVARGPQGSDLIDLTGEVIAQLPYDDAACAGSGHLIVGATVDGSWQTAVVEAATGEPAIEFAPDQRIEAVSAGLVNVSGPKGEHFVDLASGRATPHPGRVTVAAAEAGALGIPAAVSRPSARTTPKLGYLGRTGDWLVPPQFDAASAFRGGYAVVEQNGRATFLDAGMRRVGGEWERILPITVPGVLDERVVGYWVEADDRRGLLGPELQTVVQPGPGAIHCEPLAGACTVVAPDGRADLVELPEGGATALPAGYTRALTTGLVTDGPVLDGIAETRVRSLETGRAVSLPGRPACLGVGQWFTACGGAVVIDREGDRTPFSSVAVVPDPAAGAGYYWVTTAREQGFLDSDGRWRYRAPR